jgi:hypothetical protein
MKLIGILLQVSTAVQKQLTFAHAFPVRADMGHLPSVLFLPHENSTGPFFIFMAMATNGGKITRLLMLPR